MGSKSLFLSLTPEPYEPNCRIVRTSGIGLINTGRGSRPEYIMNPTLRVALVKTIRVFLSPGTFEPWTNIKFSSIDKRIYGH